MEVKAQRTYADFFTKDPAFKRRMLVLMGTITLQNIIAYSINMVDNLMLGSFSQEALSGAAIVNQVFFIVQQLCIAIADVTVLIGSQYWGKKQISPIRKLIGIALKTTAICSVIVFGLCTFAPGVLLRLFTSDSHILNEGLSYLNIVKFSFVLFMFSSCFIAGLRTVEVVRISFYLSIVTLFVNCGINGLLIFGLFGLPRLGIVGAAVGTLIARIIEFIVLLFYVSKIDKVVDLFSENPFIGDPGLSKDFRKAASIMIPADLGWSVATPFQSAILGSMSVNAIAANSIATTFYNFLKVVIRAESASSAVIIGSAIGENDIEEVKAKARNLSVIFIGTGAVLGMLLLLLKGPLLSVYTLNDEAVSMAHQMITLYAVIMVFMSYQMPVSTGIIRAGGDTKFHFLLNITGVWCVCIPLSFLAAYVWHLPVIVVVLFAQIDQIYKCVPVFLRFRKYKWIRKLTR
ncbi:MAG: MATE family efflux transporter [Eubacteriales bacterium]|nr:MATE family efflux transporter [Eubacteriales bacterium]